MASLPSNAQELDDLSQPALQQVTEDLQVLDRSIFGETPQELSAPVQVLLEKTNIKPRDVYQAYIQKAATLSKELMVLRTCINQRSGNVTLQQLGASLNLLKSRNQRFRDSFDHGEDQFQSYSLIQQAISDLDDALTYWRNISKYRPVYRNTLVAAAEDDEVLRIKLQSARVAIEELHRIMDVRDALDRDLEFRFHN